MTTPNRHVIAAAVNGDYQATRATRLREHLIVEPDGSVHLDTKKPVPAATGTGQSESRGNGSPNTEHTITGDDMSKNQSIARATDSPDEWCDCGHTDGTCGDNFVQLPADHDLALVEPPTPEWAWLVQEYADKQTGEKTTTYRGQISTIDSADFRSLVVAAMSENYTNTDGLVDEGAVHVVIEFDTAEVGGPSGIDLAPEDAEKVAWAISNAVSAIRHNATPRPDVDLPIPAWADYAEPWEWDFKHWQRAVKTTPLVLGRHGRQLYLAAMQYVRSDGTVTMEEPSLDGDAFGEYLTPKDLRTLGDWAKTTAAVMVAEAGR